jgi:hypothetical protein
MSPIQLHPSCDLAHMLPLLRDAEEGDAGIIGTLNDSSNDSSAMAYIAQSDGSDIGAAAVRWTPNDSEIVCIGILPTALGRDTAKRWCAVLSMKHVDALGAQGFLRLPADAAPRRWHPDVRYAHAAFERDGGRGAMRLWMMSLLRCVSCAASLSLARSSISNLMSAIRFGSSTASASNFR